MDAFNLGAFLIQIINFGIVLFLMNILLFRPFIKHVQEEEKKQEIIEKSYSEAQNLSKISQQKSEKILKDAQLESVKIRESAKDIAKKEADEILQKAEKEAEMKKKKMKQDMDSEKKELKKSFETMVLKSAVLLNEKLFKEKKESNKEFLKANLGK